MDNVDFSKDIRDYSGLELAFLGDAVWELEIRKYYLQFGYNIPTLIKLWYFAFTLALTYLFKVGIL